ncbi:cell envelope integrity protein TolA [Priestia aryabhattai]|uniref:cell envelope integrity protein TolA n=1 Tax=Priestia aryabhattai TaxID=412384 RepID=UPI0030ED4F73
MNYFEQRDLSSDLFMYIGTFLGNYIQLCEEDSEIVYVGADYFERTRLEAELLSGLGTYPHYGKLYLHYLDYLEGLQERILNGKVDYDSEISTLKEHYKTLLNDYTIWTDVKNCGLTYGDLDVPTIRAEYYRAIEEYGDDITAFYGEFQWQLNKAKTEEEKQAVYDRYANTIADSKAKREERLRKKKAEVELLAGMSAEEQAQYHADKLEALEAELRKYGWD